MILVRTSGRPILAGLRHRRPPIHHTADARLDVKATGTASGWVTEGPMPENLLPIYRSFDAFLLRTHPDDARREDIQRDAEQFKHEVHDKWAADRSHVRRQAIVVLIGSVLTITGIALCIVALIVG